MPYLIFLLEQRPLTPSDPILKPKDTDHTPTSNEREQGLIVAPNVVNREVVVGAT
jgi:hypothetical protein